MLIALSFVASNDNVELCAVSFSPEGDGATLVSVRGAHSSFQDHRGSFRWSKGVQAFALLLVRHAIAELRGERAGCLRGGQGSLAASLDYSLSKNPLWLLDMFGTTRSGAPFHHRIFERENPERKRPGPVAVRVRHVLMPPSSISIMVDSVLLRSPSELLAFSERLEQALGNEKDQREDAAHLTETLSKLVVDGIDFLPGIDLRKYIAGLRKDLQRLKECGADGVIIEMLKSHIKQACILGEAHFAATLGGAEVGDSLLFSCSSLIDAGPHSYVGDPQWQFLLYKLKSALASRTVGANPLRVFFVDKMVCRAENIAPLREIVQQHLESGVEVKFISDSEVGDDARDKRNMAWFGGKVLLQATDQVSWDLELSTERRTVAQARDKHAYFQSLYGCHFRLKDRGVFMNKLNRFANEVKA